MIGANSTVSIYKMVYGAALNTYPGTPTVSGVEAYIESQRAEVAQVIGVQYNVEVFMMHCDPVDVETGDKVIDQNGTEYRVVGVEKHEGNQDTDDLYTITLNKEKSTSH